MVVCHESGTFVRGWSSIYVKTFIMSASTQGSFMSSLVNSSLSENLALASCFFLQLTAWLENPPNHSKQGFPKSTCSWDRTLVHPLLSKGQGAYGQTSEYIPSIKVHAHPAETSTYFHFTWMMIYTLRSRRPVSFRRFDPFHFLPSRPHAWAIMKMMHGKKNLCACTCTKYSCMNFSSNTIAWDHTCALKLRLFSHHSSWDRAQIQPPYSLPIWPCLLTLWRGVVIVHHPPSSCIDLTELLRF